MEYLDIPHTNGHTIRKIDNNRYEMVYKSITSTHVSKTLGTESKVRLVIAGKQKVVKTDWLFNLALFNVKFPVGYEEYIFDVDFVKYTSNMKISELEEKDGIRIIYTKPLIYGNIDNVVYAFTTIDREVVISEIGKIFDVIKHKYIRISVGRYGYPLVDVRQHLNRKNGLKRRARTSVHRLLAGAWKYNDDPVNKILVNHIDTNRCNHTLSNLEWVTPLENNVHSAKLLHYSNHPYLVKDYKENTVTMYYSFSEIMRVLGVRPEIFTIENHGFTLLNNRYEIRPYVKKAKFFMDTIPTELFDKVFVSKFTALIRDIKTNKVIDSYLNLPDFEKRYGIVTHKEDLDTIRTNVKDDTRMDIFYKRLLLPFTVYNGDEVVYCNRSCKIIVDTLGLDIKPRRLYSRLIKKGYCRCGKYTIVNQYKHETTNKIKEQPIKKYLVTFPNKDDKIYTSVRELCRDINMCRKAFKNSIEKNNCVERVDGILIMPVM